VERAANSSHLPCAGARQTALGGLFANRNCAFSPISAAIPLLSTPIKTTEDIPHAHRQRGLRVSPAEMDKQTRNRAKARQFWNCLWHLRLRFGRAVEHSAKQRRALTSSAISRRYAGKCSFHRKRRWSHAQNRQFAQRPFGASGPSLTSKAATPTSAVLPSAPPSTARCKAPPAEPHQAGHDLHRSRSSPSVASKTRMVCKSTMNCSSRFPPLSPAEIEALVREEMEGVVKLSVPLVADLGFGPNWPRSEISGLGGALPCDVFAQSNYTPISWRMHRNRVGVPLHRLFALRLDHHAGQASCRCSGSTRAPNLPICLGRADGRGDGTEMDSSGFFSRTFYISQ